MPRRLLVPVIAISLWATALQASTVTAYTDKSDFLAAVDGEIEIEDFSTVSPGTLPGGNTITLLGSIGFSYEGSPDGDQPLIGNNPSIPGSREFMGEINADGIPSGTHTFYFPYEVYAFGADFYRALTTAGLTLTVLEHSFNFFELLDEPGTGFVGFVSDTPISYFTLDTARNDRSEVFWMDNVLFSPAVIPLPAGLWLLLVGLGALVGLRRGASRQ